MEKNETREERRGAAAKIAEIFRLLSADKRFDNWRKVGGCCLLGYLINTAIAALFFTEVNSWTVGAWTLMLVSLPIYALAYSAPAALLTMAAAAVMTKWRRAQLAVAGAVAALGFGATQLMLLADLGLLHNFHYHFDPFVWNLLTTPGGFASMGLRSGTIVLLSLVIAVVMAADLALMYFTVIFRNGAAALLLYRVFKGPRKLVLVALATASGFGAATLFAWNFHMKYPIPLEAATKLPACQRVTMYNFFTGIGLREPSREELLMRISTSADINYPAAPIRRRADRKKYNVVWLACESLRADMLDPETMPRTWSFAEKHGIRFTRHFSGGNGTRMGIFSMFYGLYGSYWHSFLSARKGALLIDWMIEDDYDINCFTSAMFSYPEFDNTVFARLPASSLHSDDDGATYKRDIRNSKKLRDFIAGDHGGRPFMAFMFFESPHNPYEFPPENAVFKPFVESLDYLKLSASRAPEIKNRYRNCCRTLDGYLGQVFDLLEERGLLDDTIVVLLGDHGEEFFEHGTLGHGQEFTNEQIRTPFVLHLPGRAPGVYDGMSSHLDVPAMLAPYFGVENAASDFSSGIDLLAPGAPKRKYTVLANWDGVFFAGEKYKMLLPRNSYDSITGKAFDAADRKLPGTKIVYDECRDELMEVRRELLRFMK